MLIKLSCKNFRSIGNEAIMLDMVASNKIKMHPGHVHRPTDNAGVLRNAAIYGGNAAGKSNVILALSLMKSALVGGALPQGTTLEYCRAGSGHTGEESTFEVQFEADGRIFDYGFSCIFSQYAVTSEWLYELGGKHPRCLLSRNENGSIDPIESIEAADAPDDRMRLNVYTEDFRSQVARNRALLFLPFIGNGKKFSSGSIFESYGAAFSWFANDLQVMGANQPSPTSDFYADDKTLDQVAEVLASFDTGVSSLEKRPISMDELEKRVDFGLMMTIRNFLAHNTQPAQDGNLLITARSGKAFVGIESKGGAEPTATILEIKHRGSMLPFEFGDESDGTRRLFDFMDVLFTNKKDATFVIDEIDRSLHPMLTRQLVELFNTVHQEDACQLVFTTHESSIMSFDYLRKDEIWFVDRDDDGLTSLYSLDDFELAGTVRSDSRLAKQYLEGRYGGIPCLSMAQALSALSEKGE